MFGRRYVFYFYFAGNLRSKICNENVRKPILKKIGQCVYDVKFLINMTLKLASTFVIYFQWDDNIQTC